MKEVEQTVHYDVFINYIYNPIYNINYIYNINKFTEIWTDFFSPLFGD